jgi:hypothetical protein
MSYERPRDSLDSLLSLLYNFPLCIQTSESVPVSPVSSQPSASRRSSLQEVDPLVAAYFCAKSRRFRVPLPTSSPAFLLEIGKARGWHLENPRLFTEDIQDLFMSAEEGFVTSPPTSLDATFQ